MTQLHSQNGSARRCRRGFTLVELMVAIAIVAIIATFILSAMYAAQEAARERRTQVLINKIHQQLMLRWEDYAYRRVPIDAIYLTEQGLVTGFTAEPISNEIGMDNMRAIQLGAKRELMRMEMPDKYEDLEFDPVFLRRSLGGGSTEAIENSLRQAYLAQIQARKPGPEALSDYQTRIRVSHQSAECLYLVLTTMVGEGGVFNERDFGDADGDGMPEFIDGWGRPIEWIRWPAGFFSDYQPGTPNGPLAHPATGLRTPEDLAENVDPDDPWLIDRYLADTAYDPFDATFAPADKLPRGYRLVPLVVSAGRDGAFGLAFRWDGTPQRNNDPYAVISDTVGLPEAQRGRIQNDPGESAHLDNIHNHLLSGLE